jgi:hypothetical protein
MLSKKITKKKNEHYTNSSSWHYEQHRCAIKCCKLNKTKKNMQCNVVAKSCTNEHFTKNEGQCYK